MTLRKNFIRKLWMDGRVGHSTYLMFVLTFTNFILITYNFFLEDSNMLKNIISDLWIFSIIFVIFYFPISTLIGRWHTKTQISVDNTMRLEEDPVRARMIRILLDTYTGRATEDEIKKIRKFMLKIEKTDIKEF